MGRLRAGRGNGDFCRRPQTLQRGHAGPRTERGRGHGRYACWWALPSTDSSFQMMLALIWGSPNPEVLRTTPHSALTVAPRGLLGLFGAAARGGEWQVRPVSAFLPVLPLASVNSGAKDETTASFSRAASPLLDGFAFWDWMRVPGPPLPTLPLTAACILGSCV